MPIPYYNTSSPTANSKNSINSIAVTYGIRDFLLNKNIKPVYPQLSTSLNGSPKIGEPVLDTSIGTNSVIQQTSIEVDGIFRMGNATIMNRYKNDQPNAKDLVSIDTLNKLHNASSKTTGTNGTGVYTSSDANLVENEAHFLKDATIMNLYLDSTQQIDVADWIDINLSGPTKQLTGYLDQYGALNVGNAGTPVIDMLGSILNGQGLGFTKAGIVPNFDLSASLAGRVLGATGTINDTKLGIIGGQQLALALANNAAFNVEQEILGKFNAQDNILSLINNGTLAGFRPNYKITVPSSTLGQVLDKGAQILGFTLPKSYLAAAGSIFWTESNSANIERANSMILNTGKGQVTALIKNMTANLIGTSQVDNPEFVPFRSGYAPGFKDNNGKKAINPNIYAFDAGDGLIYNFITRTSNTGVIPEISYNRTNMIAKYGFTGTEGFGPRNGESYSHSNIISPTFTWTSGKGGLVNSSSEFDEIFGSKKNLLVKTQQLFNDIGMKTIVTAKGQMGVEPSQIQTAVVGGGISKGSAVLKGSSFNGNGTSLNLATTGSAENTFARSWTTLDRYDKVQKLIRHSGLIKNTTSQGGTYIDRFNTNGSVLDDNGFAKIGPYIDDALSNAPKKYMFSIENLAWCDNVVNLLPSEIGDGDLVSGKKGRIMWFPPYNIQFTENNTANWESTNFIGRGEPIYTYNNTERTGTLSFQIIVDHPSYVNAFKGNNGPLDAYITSFFAGAVGEEGVWSDKLTVAEKQIIDSTQQTIPQKVVITPQIPPVDIDVYFPNAYPSSSQTADPLSVFPNYEVGTQTGGTANNWANNTNFDLNMIGSYSGYSDPAYITLISNYLSEECPACKVEITGFASDQGNDTAVNTALANRRADVMVAWVKKYFFNGMLQSDKDKRVFNTNNGQVISVGNVSVDSFNAKNARYATIHFVFDETLVPAAKAAPVTPQPNPTTITSKIRNRFYDESRYFEKLKETDSFVFDKIKDKIKYFHPAFHSTTPEGLNSRLTFLNQCVRQGPTNTKTNDTQNLAFGTPPVCILRIGDFYNTKIVIDNVGIDYEPLVWDLNPEGVGVQPMIANVNMSFKIIGGSSLSGPINKLQNALSFNYYANTQVYDPRADQIIKQNDNYSVLSGITNISKVSEEVLSQSALADNAPVPNMIAANDINSTKQ